ncbi:GGDEF domain-containing protein [Hyphomonas sp.]|uniref:GGDEF domain-containing protein n=1 Tax=Hyphomonas sp. TaxID=87 RepID=UPI0030F546DF
MPQTISTRKFWIGQVRNMAIVFAVSVALSFVTVYLASKGFTPDDRIAVLWMSALVPAAVFPFAMVYVGFQNLRVHRLHKQVHHFANSDDLTGLANRRCFHREATRRISDAAGGSRSIALILVDIDWFKQVNDTHGHEAGDETLCHVANTLLRVAPQGSLVARLGGEEFTVLCEVGDEADLGRAAEALRKGIEATRFYYQGETINVTISLGLSVLRSGDTLATLLSRTDKALYDAKSYGRNRFELAA